MHAGAGMTDTDSYLARRTAEAGTWSTTCSEEDGRRVVYVAGIVDGCDISIRVEVPAEFDGVDLYSPTAESRGVAATQHAFAKANRRP